MVRLSSACLAYWVIVPKSVTGWDAAVNLARPWGLIKTGYECSRHSVEVAVAFLLGGWLEGWPL